MCGREVTSCALWCTSWRKHKEAVAQLYWLWMEWRELAGPESGASGHSARHRDHLTHVMASLRDPSGPFAGCKDGSAQQPDHLGKPVP
ncbi:DUF4913 domain-containing protein [Streptomyces sp. NBC_00986]|uniref:DUF4913 domain-containing protein n=1 Tax=Streptomyces sp. NBC_00986 TaxID=2903702 RepID=UPI0038656E44|nr:DUF4913 domain-containing protein [Streptomyces sp. NBC_00986]